jgi:hypothetical protein
MGDCKAWSEEFTTTGLLDHDAICNVISDAFPLDKPGMSMRWPVVDGARNQAELEDGDSDDDCNFVWYVEIYKRDTKRQQHKAFEFRGEWHENEKAPTTTAGDDSTTGGSPSLMDDATDWDKLWMTGVAALDSRTVSPADSRIITVDIAFNRCDAALTGNAGVWKAFLTADNNAWVAFTVAAWDSGVTANNDNAEMEVANAKVIDVEPFLPIAEPPWLVSTSASVDNTVVVTLARAWITFDGMLQDLPPNPVTHWHWPTHQSPRHDCGMTQLPWPLQTSVFTDGQLDGSASVSGVLEVSLLDDDGTSHAFPMYPEPLQSHWGDVPTATQRPRPQFIITQSSVDSCVDTEEAKADNSDV